MAHSYRDIPAAGTKLQITIGYSLVDVDGATEVSIDGYKRAVRNPTHLQSLAVAKKPGMPDFGQIKCKVFYDPNDATHQYIRDSVADTAASKSANLDSFKLIFADGYTTPAFVEFDGFVSDFSIASGEAETGTVTADMTIEVTEITGWTDGSPAE